MERPGGKGGRVIFTRIFPGLRGAPSPNRVLSRGAYELDLLFQAILKSVVEMAH